MKTREPHPFVKHLFTLIKDAKLQPNERLQQVEATLKEIAKLLQNELESYQLLAKISPALAVKTSADELKLQYSLDAVEGDESLLCLACQNEMVLIVKLLLENKAHPEFLSPKDSVPPPLNIAAFNGNVEILDLLLNAKAKPNSTNPKTGNTPLISAANQGKIECVKALLKAGANTDDVNLKDDSTAIMWAASNNHHEVIKLLMEAKADFKLGDRNGASSLHYAAQYGRMKAVETFVETLLEAKAEVDTLDAQRKTPLMWAAENGHSAVVKFLLSKGANPKHISLAGETALHLAAQAGDDDAVRTLLEAKADADIIAKNGNTPLMVAVRTEQNAEVIKLLVEAKADPNFMHQNGQTPLYVAIYVRQLGNVKELLTCKALPNKPTMKEGKEYLTPLHFASCAKDCVTEILRALLDKNASPNVVHEKTKNTPLMDAVIVNNVDNVKLLLERKAKPNIFTKANLTPLIHAALYGYADVVKALLEKDAYPDLANPENGRTPLMEACEYGHLEVVTALLEKKADANLTDKDGFFPLYLALKVNLSKPGRSNSALKARQWLNLQIAEKLLNSGAQIDKATKHPHPWPVLMHIANVFMGKNENTSTIAFLLRHRATVFDPEQLYGCLMQADQSTPGLLEALKLFCEQQRNLRKPEVVKTVNPQLLLKEPDFTQAEAHLKKLTKLSEMYDAEMKSQIGKGVAEEQKTLNPDLINLIAGYASPLEQLSFFSASQVDQLLAAAEAKQNPTPTPTKADTDSKRNPPPK